MQGISRRVFHPHRYREDTGVPSPKLPSRTEFCVPEQDRKQGHPWAPLVTEEADAVSKHQWHLFQDSDFQGAWRSQLLSAPRLKQRVGTEPVEPSIPFVSRQDHGYSSLGSPLRGDTYTPMCWFVPEMGQKPHGFLFVKA